MSESEDQPPPLQPPAYVSQVSIKLPEFWTDEPDLWFMQAEAQFALYKPPIVLQRTMFYHVISKIPAAVSREVKPFIKTPAWASAYDDLKAQLIKIYTPTKWQKADALLNHPGIGDRRPTALWNSMLAQLPDGEPPGVLFQAMFLARLPAEIRAHLVARDFSTPLLMAEHADRLWDTRQTATVAAVAVDQDFEDLPGVAKVTARPDRSPSSSRRPPTPARPTPTPRGLCFYHNRFGSDAQKCESPCSYQGNSRTGGRRRN